ncbi:MAG: hypothetical protein SOR61_05915 [Evtepia sp.]|uniref:hypothetical protein n=1 Tax=Evtepia sp. TaxID=2773933 RepID=UPI002A748230|nr:hypothetical protein [Evtepia sp.]MDY3014710.1 hypothetical protein [Evtepia sp.]
MQLIGQPIKHNQFGKGIVTDWQDTIITVCFDIGEKKFIYPDAFAEFLVLKNDGIQKQIQALLDDREAKKEEERTIFREMQERKYLLKNLKTSPQSQAVFDVEAEKAEEVLSSWSVSTGCYFSGYSRGFPRVPDRLTPHSMCLLTVREKEQPETERRIIGAFMVKEDFLGIYCRDGMVPSHPDHRLKLPLDQQPLFWPYIAHEVQKQRWGKVAFKYMSKYIAERILFDIKHHVDEEEAKNAEEFYRYFCEVNRLHLKTEVESIDEPDF